MSSFDKQQILKKHLNVKKFSIVLKLKTLWKKNLRRENDVSLEQKNSARWKKTLETSCSNQAKLGNLHTCGTSNLIQAELQKLLTEMIQDLVRVETAPESQGLG